MHPVKRPFDAANTPSKAWRWGSVAELARGGAIQEQVAPGQDKSTQDNLYAAALSHFVRAARTPSRCSSYPELVVRSAEAMWNCSLHLSGSSVSRRLARSSLEVYPGLHAGIGYRDSRFIKSRRTSWACSWSASRTTATSRPAYPTSIEL